MLANDYSLGMARNSKMKFRISLKFIRGNSDCFGFQFRLFRIFTDPIHCYHQLSLPVDRVSESRPIREFFICLEFLNIIFDETICSDGLTYKIKDFI